MDVFTLFWVVFRKKSKSTHNRAVAATYATVDRIVLMSDNRKDERT